MEIGKPSIHTVYTVSVSMTESEATAMRVAINDLRVMLRPLHKIQVPSDVACMNTLTKFVRDVTGPILDAAEADDPDLDGEVF